MAFFVVIACACSFVTEERRCHWLCQVTQFAACLAIIARMTCGARVIVAVLLLLLLLFEIVVVVCALICKDGLGTCPLSV
jgi:hypothetical protein